MQPTITPTPSQSIHNPLEAMQPGEQIICEVRRSPIGLFIPYFMASVIIVAAVAAALLVPYYMDTFSRQEKLGIVLGAILAAAATLLYVYITTLVYTANRWIVTSDSLTQISQSGLTTTESSQFSLEELEDMSVEQSGILQMFFGYGTLHAETAGEHSKFIFPYCPTPEEYARKILAAREAFAAKGGQ